MPHALCSNSVFCIVNVKLTRLSGFFAECFCCFMNKKGKQRLPAARGTAGDVPGIGLSCGAPRKERHWNTLKESLGSCTKPDTQPVHALSVTCGELTPARKKISKLKAKPQESRFHLCTPGNNRRKEARRKLPTDTPLPRRQGAAGRAPLSRFLSHAGARSCRGGWRRCLFSPHRSDSRDRKSVV